MKTAVKTRGENKPSLGPILNAIAYDGKALAYRFRGMGGDLDRWQRADWLAMARILTAEEDRLEMLYPSAARLAQRNELKALRRGLEGAC